MSRREVRELRKKAREADLSTNNTKIQQLFEKELEEWVESYETKKDPRHSFHDCYGSPGEIPDRIYIDDKNYGPMQILEHVKMRDEIGMNVLRKIEKYRDESRFNPKAIKKIVFSSVKDNTNLNDVFMQCVCGEHNLTYRGLLEGIINADLDLLKLSLPAAIMRLYGRVDDLVYDKVD